MRIAGEDIGRRGAAALAVTAVVGAVMAIHGYGNPGSLGLSGGALVGGKPLAASKTPSPSPTPSGTAAPTASPSASPTAAATPGPLLSSTSYGPYSYQLYPGTPSANAKLALAGFTYRVKPGAGSVTFTLTILGGSQAPITKTYPSSDHIYFVEASFGDDAQNAEYNFGDDGLVVTNASGHVVG